MTTNNGFLLAVSRAHIADRIAHDYELAQALRHLDEVSKGRWKDDQRIPLGRRIKRFYRARRLLYFWAMGRVRIGG